MALWLAVPLAVLGLATLALWVFQRSLIYFPDAGRPPPAGDVLPGGQDVRPTTSDGLELSAWYVPAPEAGATVLVAPGNGGNRAGRAELGRVLVDAGYGVLLLDYRGYGGNPGSPSEEGLARDVRAARDFLLGDAGVPEDRLLYLGESLGAAVAAELAAEHRPAGLLLRSPFTSLADAGRAAYGVPVGWLLRDTFAVEEAMDRVQAPVAVVHGDADSIVPTEHSGAVAAAARAAGNEVHEAVVPGADHNDPRLVHGPEVVAALEWLVARRPPSS